EQKGEQTGKQDARKQDAAKLAKAALESLKKNKIEIDFKKQTITVPVVVNAPTDSIEYLLIHRNGKAHEAVLITYAKPSVLNSAFLFLGLKEGRNFDLKDKDPMPSEAELRKGVSPYVEVLPVGRELFMTVSMQLEDGKEKVMAVEDLVFDLHTQRPVTNNKWIYLGSRMVQFYRGEPEVFAADMEGNLVSTCYMRPKNHLLTMVHERARDDQNWWLSAACPQPGTKMKLTFHLRKPKVIAAREKRVKDIKGEAAPLPDPASRRVPGKGPGSRPTSRKND
ncbi:MAG: YdjY domain-containing protein, partial [Planctomycetota bacterium]